MLRTNLPKEIMGYPDFPIPQQEKSFIPAKDILNYLHTYAEKFNLKPFVKFNHHVKSVEPAEGGKWKLTVIDLPNNKEGLYEFDAVMVCNGHYSKPWTPVLDGADTFPGRQLHSHDYREPSPFKGQRVIIVGAGPSGVDLCLDISTTAERVILSRHADMEINSPLPSNVEQRLEVRSISGSNVTFVDGTSFDADVIFYCTGYIYNFPFLKPECGIYVEDNYLRPLYKHLINIRHPSMCLVGLPFYVCHFSLFDLQVKFFMKTLSGEIPLPSREEMTREELGEMEKRERRGMKKRQFHKMGPLQDGYYRELSEMGRLPPIPPVMARLHSVASQRQLDDLRNFREDVYKLINSEEFIRVN